MITLFSVRPKGPGLNVGNEAIFVGLRHLLRQAFGGHVNIVPMPAMPAAESPNLSGFLPQAVHEMNLYGHGVIVGGGNLYENGQLALDTHALRTLRPPLMLFSLSHGRIYDHRHRLALRSDSMTDAAIAALHGRAAISVARDEATLAYLRSLELPAVLGGCPSLLLREVANPVPGDTPSSGTLLAIRHPHLMNIPLRDQARVHDAVLGIIDAATADGWGPVRLLCHDTRDVAFASSLGDVEYLFADDIHHHLALLRNARLLISFRLHAFLPCASFGVPAINLSYDERSLSLVRTVGLGAWDIDFARSRDVVGEVRDRCRRLDEFAALRERAQPRWNELERVMRESIAAFASLVTAYAAEGASS